MVLNIHKRNRKRESLRTHSSLAEKALIQIDSRTPRPRCENCPKSISHLISGRNAAAKNVTATEAGEPSEPPDTLTTPNQGIRRRRRREQPSEAVPDGLRRNRRRPRTQPATTRNLGSCTWIQKRTQPGNPAPESSKGSSFLLESKRKEEGISEKGGGGRVFLRGGPATERNGALEYLAGRRSCARLAGLTLRTTPRPVANWR